MTDYASALITVICTAVLVMLYYGPWQSYCTDHARQRLFMIRNKLFDMALRGEVSFDSEAYRALRSHIERLIRFAHQTTWVRIAWLAIGTRKIGFKGENQVKALIGNLDEPLRTAFQNIYLEAGGEIVTMIVRKSMLTRPLMVAIFLIRRILIPALKALMVSETLARRPVSFGSAISQKVQSLVHEESEALRA